ncbi:MAG: hypothetical protein H0V01_07595 [Bacteroidetes bacterium]|nr:hypothetical protein [Bacteroidota bacterium]HET6243975.1 hypothetical protein [Bacteroidia bacterium]
MKNNNLLIKYTIGIFLILITLGSCAPTRFVKPLEKDQKAVAFNLGGPLIGFAGTTIPIPFTALTYGQGLNAKTTAFGSIHTTSLLYGNIQSDIGVLREIKAYDTTNALIPGISMVLAGNFIYGTFEKKAKLWPQGDLNFYWDINKKRHFIYLGISNWFEFATKKAHEQAQTKNWFINPHFGISGQGKKWNSQLEMKYLAPGISNQNIVVDYASFGNTGAIGVYYSITRKF